jgi:hypothetical protein
LSPRIHIINVFFTYKKAPLAERLIACHVIWLSLGFLASSNPALYTLFSVTPKSLYGLPQTPHGVLRLRTVLARTSPSRVREFQHKCSDSTWTPSCCYIGPRAKLAPGQSVRSPHGLARNTWGSVKTSVFGGPELGEFPELTAQNGSQNH